METFVSVDPPLSGNENMLIDSDNFLTLENDRSNTSPTCKIRIYEWQRSTVSLGSTQVIKARRNKHKLEDYFQDYQCQFDIVERVTGGRMVLHHREITYSVVAPITSVLGNNLVETYTSIAHILLNFLSSLGINARYNAHKEGFDQSLVCYAQSGFGEIEVEGKKLIGSAQKRGRNYFLQHGSIPFYHHDLRLEGILKPEYTTKETIDYVFLSDYCNLDIISAKNKLKTVFQNFFHESQISQIS